MPQEKTTVNKKPFDSGPLLYLQCQTQLITLGARDHFVPQCPLLSCFPNLGAYPPIEVLVRSQQGQFEYYMDALHTA